MPSFFESVERFCKTHRRGALQAPGALKRWRSHLSSGTAKLLIAVLLNLFFAIACWAAQPAEPPVRMPIVTAKMHEYSRLEYLSYFFGVAYEMLVFYLIVESGLSSYMRDRAETDAKNPIAQFLLYFVSLYLVLALAGFPLAYGCDFVMEHYFGLSKETFLNWIGDLLKAGLIIFAVLAPVNGAFFWLVRKFPKRWPIYFCIVCSVVAAFETFASPIIFEPMLNKFTPMEESPLKTQIQQLAAKAGAPDAPIIVADKSRQTEKFNAYVSGLGSSTHVVIWDTTLKLPPDQVLGIVGHELGHYYYHHVLLDFLLVVGVNILIVPINMYLAAPFAAHLPKRWKIRGLGDYAILPVVALIAGAGAFLSDPLTNYITRMEESAADAFSLKVTGNRNALARVFVSLSEQNLSDPDPPPFIKFWLFSHPTLKERIEFALGTSAPPSKLDEARQEAKLHPHSVQAHLDLGSILLEVSEYSGAISEYEQALRLDPKNADAIFYLSRVYQETGDKRQESELLRRFLQTGSPADPHGKAAQKRLKELQ
ncbi:MAG TPA: M48 family metalloprotease [Planktothrix sp.]